MTEPLKKYFYDVDTDTIIEYAFSGQTKHGQLWIDSKGGGRSSFGLRNTVHLAQKERILYLEGMIKNYKFKMNIPALVCWYEKDETDE